MLGFFALSGLAMGDTFAGTLHGDMWHHGTPPTNSDNAEVWREMVLHGTDGVNYVVRDGAAADEPHTAMAAACMGGMAVVEGKPHPLLGHGFAEWEIDNARVVACVPVATTPPSLPGQSVALTGKVHAMWRYGPPGFGASPSVDRPGVAAELLVGSARVPLVVADSVPMHEMTLMMLACDGQEMSVTGVVVTSRAIGLAPTWRLQLGELPSPCAQPAWRAPGDDPVPLPPTWFLPAP